MIWPGEAMAALLSYGAFCYTVTTKWIYGTGFAQQKQGWEIMAVPRAGEGSVPSSAELTLCRDLLVSAKAAASWVAAAFHSHGNIGAAARLNAIAAQVASEVADIERLLNAPPKP